MNTAYRLKQLRQLLAMNELDCLVITSPANRYYLSGFTGDNGILVITPETQFIFTDFRYLEQVAQEAPDYAIQRSSTVKVIPELGGWLNKQIRGRIGFEPGYLSVQDHQELTALVCAKRLVPAGGLVEELRATKDEEEIERITRAAAINDRALAKLLPSIKPGVIEKALAAELEYLMRMEGADGTAFSTIIASGPRGALPHGVAANKRLAAGELVVIDFGARLDGYCSDMTRTIAVGDPGARAREIYRVVGEAQARALAALKPGLKGSEVDAIARDYIKEAGYGEYFGHGLGHSVGVEIHEEPRLSATSDKELKPGMVVTVEPGIYLPGFGGVRTEDLVVIVEEGCINLTASTKNLLELAV